MEESGAPAMTERNTATVVPKLMERIYSEIFVSAVLQASFSAVRDERRLFVVDASWRTFSTSRPAENLHCH